MSSIRFYSLLLSGLICSGVFGVAAGPDRRAPVALVNKVPITAGELEDELAKLLPVNAMHGKMVDSRQRGELQQRALDELVARKLALQYAGAHGIAVPPAEVRAGVMRIRGRYRSERSFQEAIQIEGITAAGLEARVREELILKRVYKLEVESRSRVTDAEVRSYFAANRARYKLPETLRLHAIFVKDGPDARKKAEQALAAVTKAKGEFDAAAGQYSDDDYRVMGGDYGIVHRGRLPEAAEKAVFGAPTAKVMGPVKVEQGWLVFRTDARQAARQMTFPEMRQRIAKELEAKKIKEARTAFRQRLEKGASITYLAQQPTGTR